MEGQDLKYRVTVDENGALRWTYPLDLRRNRAVFSMMMKIIAAIGLAMGLFAMALGDWAGVPGWFMGLVFAGGFTAVGLLIYGIMLLAYRGVMPMHFVMTDELVTQVYTPKEQSTTDALAAVALVAGLATGHAGQALGTSTNLYNSTRNSTCYFSWVRRVVRRRENDLLVLKRAVFRSMIFVPPEDYDLVEDYIVSRAGAEVRDEQLGEERRTGRRLRLLIAAGVSLVVNLVTLIININAYNATGALKLAGPYQRGGDYGFQAAFALRAEDWFVPEAPFQHRLSFSWPYAVIGFLAVALAVWLVLTVAAAVGRRGEKR